MGRWARPHVITTAYGNTTLRYMRVNFAGSWFTTLNPANPPPPHDVLWSDWPASFGDAAVFGVGQWHIGFDTNLSTSCRACLGTRAAIRQLYADELAAVIASLAANPHADYIRRRLLWRGMNPLEWDPDPGSTFVHGLRTNADVLSLNPVAQRLWSDAGFNTIDVYRFGSWLDPARPTPAEERRAVFTGKADGVHLTSPGGELMMWETANAIADAWAAEAAAGAAPAPPPAAVAAVTAVAAVAAAVSSTAASTLSGSGSTGPRAAPAGASSEPPRLSASAAAHSPARATPHSSGAGGTAGGSGPAATDARGAAHNGVNGLFGATTRLPSLVRGHAVAAAAATLAFGLAAVWARGARAGDAARRH